MELRVYKKKNTPPVEYMYTFKTNKKRKKESGTSIFNLLINFFSYPPRFVFLYRKCKFSTKINTLWRNINSQFNN